MKSQSEHISFQIENAPFEFQQGGVDCGCSIKILLPSSVMVTTLSATGMFYLIYTGTVTCVMVIYTLTHSVIDMTRVKCHYQTTSSEKGELVPFPLEMVGAARLVAKKKVAIHSDCRLPDSGGR